jgi:hypothetical protein
LIGLINPASTFNKTFLENFKEQAGFTKYINVGEATADNLAKLADWVSQSVSSQSQQVGSNAPSQVLDF